MFADPNPKNALPPRQRVPIGVGAWALALLLGFGSLLSYQMRAGPAASSSGHWPLDATLPFDSHRYNLVMFAHPRCPCSAASLEELQVALVQARGKINAIVCFFAPPDEATNWTETSLMRTARAIPGVHVVVDRDGAATDRFGAMTSGQVLLFDSEGRRVFSGGITGARGHAGWNRGRALVVAAAQGEFCASDHAPVYGCTLHDPEEIKERSL